MGKETIAAVIYHPTPSELINAVANALNPAKRVLDIGCGVLPETYLEPSELHILVEPYEQYVRVLQEKFGTSPKFMILQGTALDVIRYLPDRCVDTTFLLDVLEHVNKDDGRRLIREMDRVSRRQIVIFSPVGEIDQSVDIWGYEGHDWQSHRSAWVPADFDSNWQIRVCEDYHKTSNLGVYLTKPVGAMFCVKTKQLPHEDVYMNDAAKRLRQRLADCEKQLARRGILRTMYKTFRGVSGPIRKIAIRLPH